MAQSTRQTNLLVQQDWTKIYQTFTNADFTSYDFETLRNSMINYIKAYYPETFNDFLESSEYIALIDLIAFLGQSLAFRTDLNARENFIDTAQRRDSILKLARMLSYNPSRTNAASGLLKIDSVKTTESVIDSNGINLANATINWNDITNDNWLEQFTTVFNAALVSSESFGKPGNSQTLSGVNTDEYTVALNPNTLPVAPFSVNVQGTSIAFEAVSATSVNKTFIYEDDPTKYGKFNLLYRNDNNGNGSNNTGFFLFVKQGSLNSTNFSIQNSIPNNFVSVNTNNITNGDQWLYSLDVSNNPQTLWSPVPALPGVNVIFNNLTDKNLYQVNTRNNDQVDLVFGDGSFANIPQGNFKFFYRTGNGATYSITPDDLSSVSIGLSYISKRNTVETLTITASLKYTITNANAAPTLTSIKTNAPQQYYTQNRMITAEDYNIFPQTTFTSIQKIKAVNRTSSGVSLYLDAIDPTGSYSSTNIFGDDGNLVASANGTIKSTTFDFLTTNDIYNAIYNRVIPIIASTEVQNRYYANASTRYNSTYANIGGLVFNQQGNSTSSSNGFLQYLGDTQAIGPGTIGNTTIGTTGLQYIAPGASLQFCAPAGQYFTTEGSLTTIGSGNTKTIYATVTSITSNVSNVTPATLVTLGTFVPNGAILSDSTSTGNNAIIPPYKTTLTNDVIAVLISQIKAKSNFAIRYNWMHQAWENITQAELNANPSIDWSLKFTFDNGLYNIDYRVLEYTFGSTSSTKFYFDPTTRVYSSATGTNVSDTIKILNINPKDGQPGVPMAQDVIWQIYNTLTQTDGYVDDTKVLIKAPSTQMEGVPDNPDLYNIVANVGHTYRNGLYFHYKHNVPSRSRIDPTPVNIIDIYVLTSTYTTNYTNWLRDLTGTVVEPTPPTSSSLEIDYSSLDTFKAVSDTVIYNPAKFKPLFGAKADPSLQARFQVIKNPAAGLTDNEIKTQVISAINNYFDVTNWDFGDTFYFSELAAYLHTTLAPNISSIVIVPTDDTLKFGNYFQINADPWEIITSAATVNDIDIVPAVTAAYLNLGTTLRHTFD
jgi:hypothetical protein